VHARCTRGSRPRPQGHEGRGYRGNCTRQVRDHRRRVADGAVHRMGADASGRACRRRV